MQSLRPQPRGPIAQELRPSACTSAPIPIAYSPSSKRRPASSAATKSASPASPAARLARKYVAYRVDDSRTSYGTLPRASDAAWTRPLRPAAAEQEPLLKAPASPASNQSETESDSDSACSSTASSSSGSASAAVLQSILRISTGDLGCRSVRKQASVEFAVDVSDDEEASAPRRWRRNPRTCAARCVPRYVSAAACG